VGISAYGADAGFSDSGTHSSTAHRSNEYPYESETTLFRTEFSTGEFRGECYGLPYRPVPRVKQHAPCPKMYTKTAYVHMCLWQVESVGWYGGGTMVHTSQMPRSGNCAPYDRGLIFDSDYGNAIDWSSGFELGIALNIKAVNLKASFNSTAHTGYDNNAYMSFYFGHNGTMCGTDGPPSTAAVLVQRGT
jgi:hypothetical protein